MQVIDFLIMYIDFSLFYLRLSQNLFDTHEIPKVPDEIKRVLKPG
jgi:hypothetical protein